MTTLKSEQAQTILGVEGRAFNVIRWSVGESRWSGRIANQKWVSEIRDTSDGRMKVEIRFDDECKNGHESFAITAEIKSRRGGSAFGCLHEDVAEYFPELAPLIKWHHMATDGPMHYIANTVYHASNLGSDGLPAGQPTNFKTLLLVGNSPVPYELKGKFVDFLKGALTNAALTFAPVEVKHKKIDIPGEYQYSSQYTISGFDCDWGGAPFDSIQEAQAWCEAINSNMVRFERVSTGISAGKERQLDHARSSAVWPEATDEQLCLPKGELTALLEARLPALIVEFKAVINSIGFLWSANND